MKKRTKIICLILFQVIIVLTFSKGYCQNLIIDQNEKEQKNYIMNANGSKSWDGQTRHWHVTPKGDTIVSSLGKEFPEEMQKFDNSREVSDLPDDPQHPMYGLNEYIPAWNENYATDLDFYGSGDVNNDGVIDMEDYNSNITSSDPFGDNDGSYRFDTDLDGDAGDSQDKAIILDYINGNRTHINKWELESATEKESHLVNALAIDPTSEVNATSSGWLCGQYSDQTFINFNGVYDIANSVFANNNGTNLQYDLTHNGIFRIPLRIVDTKTGSNTAHIINNVYLGAPENQDATEYEDRIYFEPQSDQIQENGDYSLNQYAHEKWYGYYYNDFLNQWGYFSRRLVEYGISGANPIITYQHPDFVISSTPFDDVEWPENQTLEYYEGITTTPEGPSNLYPGTVASNTFSTTKTNNGTCSDVNYDDIYNHTLEAGAYNASNTPAGNHDEVFHIQDTQGAYIVSTPINEGDTIYRADMSDSPDPTEEEWAEFDDNSGLSIDKYFTKEIVYEDGVNRVWEISQWGEDVCQNNPEDYFNYYVNIPKTLGVNENSLGGKVNNAYVFPNPTKTNLTINYNSEKTQEIKTSLYSISGKEVGKKASYEVDQGNNKVSYVLTDVKPGIYLLKIEDEKGNIETEKVEIK